MDEATLRVVKIAPAPAAELHDASSPTVREPKREGDAPRPRTDAGTAAPGAPPVGDGIDFLARLADHGAQLTQLRNERRRSLDEIEALRAENRWEDILALFHPVEEKAPELEAVGLANGIRAEMAFALGHLNRFEEAIQLYQVCVEAEPVSFHAHAGLAYTAYNSLYAAKTRQVMLHPAERRARIDLAHEHFLAAQRLRPEGVTNYYRQGMLFKQIQSKHDKALPLFETAVRNWRAYGEELQKTRHQERKNYVKALYHLASCLLETGRARQALDRLKDCLREDESSSHLSAVHKFFALGKVHFQLGDYRSAIQALEAAAVQADPGEEDYVFELLARAHLALGDLSQASKAINRIPPPRRRPYVRWTEADVLATQGDLERACRVLQEAADRDRRGSHKALIRLARIEFRRHHYEQALKAARRASDFFQGQYHNPFFDGLFWQAAALLRLGRPGEAQEHFVELERLQPGYPNLCKLKQLLPANLAEPSGD